MELKPDRPPRLDDINYFLGPDAGWSTQISEQRPPQPLWQLPGGYTSISAMFVPGAQRWVVLYSRADRDLRPKDPIVVRLAPHPTGPWSDEINLFFPASAYGQFIHAKGDDDLQLRDPANFLKDETGLPYGPFIIAPLTKWHPTDRSIELHYLMSTWRPYQVHHMRSRFFVD